jgi:hypothetical protein
MFDKVKKSCHLTTTFILTNLLIPVAIVFYTKDLYDIWFKK